MRTRSGARSSRNSTTRQRGGTCSGTTASPSGEGSSGAVCCAFLSSAQHAAARVTQYHGGCVLSQPWTCLHGSGRTAGSRDCAGSGFQPLRAAPLPARDRCLEIEIYNVFLVRVSVCPSKENYCPFPSHTLVQTLGLASTSAGWFPEVCLPVLTECFLL